MILSDRESKILASAELQADLPITELQKRTGFRSHVIRYELHSLEKRGAIHQVPFVDMYPLGYQDFGFYFSLASLQSEAKERLLNVLKESPFITFLVELGGDYQYCAGMYVKHVSEFVDIMDRLSESSPSVFFDKAITMRVFMTRFNRKYLDVTAPVRELSFGGSRISAAIDELDERILALMNEHGASSRRQLAQSLGVAFSTLQHRMQVLEQKGIFKGLTYSVNPEKIGMQPFQLLVYTKGLRPTFQQQLFEYAKAHSNVVYFVRCIGAWDFEIGIEVRRPEDATQISQDLYERFGPDLLSIKILPIFSFLKFAFFRPSGVFSIQK